MSSEKKWPFIQWFVMDWLGDPKVSRCAPATRGVLFDWLCNMHALDRSGVISGTLEELARLGRCSAVQCQEAIADLKRTNAAEVTERHGLVTVVNRRMKREYSLRSSANSRQQRARCHAPVTPHNYNQSTEPEAIGQSSYSAVQGKGDGGKGLRIADCGLRMGESSREPEVPKGETRNAKVETRNGAAWDAGAVLTAGRLRGVAVRICNNEDGWWYDNCKVPRNGFPLSQIETCLRAHVGSITCGQAVKAWLGAVLKAHKDVVDGMVVKNAEASAVDEFKRQLKVHPPSSDFGATGS